MIPSAKFGTAQIKRDAHSTHQQIQSHFISKKRKKKKNQNQLHLHTIIITLQG